MAETEKVTPDPANGGKGALPSKSPPTTVRPPFRGALDRLHAQPLPVRTFPLPSFYPSNPLSLVHIVYAWMSQALFPPPPEPSVVHQGVWDATTRSVNITDPASVRALWEQGFFGKGSLSRSEPNWLKREKVRRGLVENTDTSEMRTLERRKEREQMKWERGRTALEAIDRQLQEEIGQIDHQTQLLTQEGQTGPVIGACNSRDKQNGLPVGYTGGIISLAPIGPLELLALPNSDNDLRASATEGQQHLREASQKTRLSNGAPLPASPEQQSVETSPCPTTLMDETSGPDPRVNGIKGKPSPSPNGHVSGTTAVEGPEEIKPLKQQKSVRFSLEVESTTFQNSDPPSPKPSTNLIRRLWERTSNSQTPSPKPSDELPTATEGRRQAVRHQTDTASTTAREVAISDKEHLQLSAEEALFLAFAIGALAVRDAETKASLTTKQLLTLFREHSYFPPRVSDTSGSLSPADPFLIQFAVYYHFRSMGWVPRHGMKFSVDWLLYKRGPVFDHAEFGLIVIPSFSHPWWDEHGHQLPTRRWQWFHGVSRTLSRVFKSMVLVYVDIPPPNTIAGDDIGIADILRQYRIREIMVKRWSPNRNRG